MQEELNDVIGLNEFNQGMEELKLLALQLADTAVFRRVKKEIQQLSERRGEIAEFEEARKNSKAMSRVLTLEEKKLPCPENKHHRLELGKARMATSGVAALSLRAVILGR